MSSRVVATIALLFVGLSLVGGRGCSSLVPVSPPLPAAGLHVLVVEETDQRPQLPQEQLSIFSSIAIREAVEAAGGKMLVIDPSEFAGDALPEPWKTGVARPRDKLPWMIVSSKKASYEGPLPANVDQVLELISKSGGE